MERRDGDFFYIIIYYNTHINKTDPPLLFDYRSFTQILRKINDKTRKSISDFE